MKTLQIPRQQQNARTLALQVLLECRQHNAFVQEILDQHLMKSALAPADRRLAAQLVYGTLRRRGTIDALLSTAVTRRRDQVEPWLWEALRLGVYQLILLSHIPAHAALFETVELAVRAGKPRGKGFLNAVLRKIASLVTHEHSAQPGPDAVPLEHGVYRRLSGPVLPDPAPQPLDYFAAAFSFPKWLAERWLDRFGWEECVRLGFWFARPAPLWLRCNTLRTDRAKLLAALADAGVAGSPGDIPRSIRLAEHVPVTGLPGFTEGWFSVQDESAMRVGEALAPAPGSRVLDLCAAPGGKTAHLAELMKNQGAILACDVDLTRLRTLEEHCRRLGVSIVELHLLHPQLNEDPPEGPFDAILVDVPCSNTGVLGRRPEVRWRLRPADFRRLVSLQTKLLLQAAERVQLGGAVVYSTCSIEPEENENVVRVVLQAMPDLDLEAEQQQLPGQPADGGYWARLRKQGQGHG
jgi:16S rRNA (cytosine967-C5)-methyltransferase